MYIYVYGEYHDEYIGRLTYIYIYTNSSNKRCTIKSRICIIRYECGIFIL